MRIQCDYCGQYIRDTDAVCPHCGAPNDGMMRSAAGVPKTIGELQEFCRAHNLPLAQMRFFLGQDIPDARAFGIFRDDDGNFVVYKNKSDGSRAVRYRGGDEAYAVNEIFQKMKEEIIKQRQRKASSSGGTTRSRRASRSRRGVSGQLVWILVICYFIAMLFLFVAGRLGKTHNGYYNYNGNTYYSQSDTWYQYDNSLLDWYPVTVDEELQENASDYYAGSNYSSSYNAGDFSDSEYYQESAQDSSWSDDCDDSDWDWDSSDSWDSGSTDWDSDW